MKRGENTRATHTNKELYKPQGQEQRKLVKAEKGHRMQPSLIQKKILALQFTVVASTIAETALSKRRKRQPD